MAGHPRGLIKLCCQQIIDIAIMTAMNRRHVIRTLGASLFTGVGVDLPALAAASGMRGAVFALPQDFGAVADGKHLDSSAINKAIAHVSGSGGGTVYVRAGVYLCGTVVLKSRVTLYLEAGAVLLGSKEIADYTPQPGPSATGDAGQRHLIFSRDAEDVTIAGPGLIDGQGKSFWVPTHRAPLPPEEQWQDVATRDWTFKPRVSPMIELVGCTRLRLSQVRVENSSGWTMRLINCVNVVVDGINIKNPVYGINVDGIDVSNSSDVRISNCSIDTADDAICLKSENPYGSTVPACRNITITNCTLTGCCNGLKFGTRTEGAFENIVFSNSVIHNAEVPLAERIISGIAVEMVDGGSVDGVVITGIRMQRTRTPIFLRLGDRSRHEGGSKSSLRHVMISDIFADGAVMTSSIMGVPGLPIEDVTLANVEVDTSEETKAEWRAREIPEVVAEYPEARMFGRLPAYGLYCRHVHGLVLRDLAFSSKLTQATSAIACSDVRDVEIRGLRVSPKRLEAAAISLENVSSAWIHSMRTTLPMPSLLHASGKMSSDILVSHCDVRQALQAFSTTDDVPAGAVRTDLNVQGLG